MSFATPYRPVLNRAASVLALVGALGAPLAGIAGAADPAPAVPTSLRITTPASVPTGSSADVWVRLVHAENGGEEPVGSATVLVQRQSPSGWSQVASFTTRADGLAHGAVAIGSTARYRAYYRGDAARAASTSREVVISATSMLGQRAVAEAKRHQGAAYLYGAAGPYRFDCSGFTMYVYRRLGKSLPHSSREQAAVTRRIANSAKRPGDLIFGYHGSTIGHVGIYAGGSMMWASVESGDTVRLQSFAGRAYIVSRVS